MHKQNIVGSPDYPRLKSVGSVRKMSGSCKCSHYQTRSRENPTAGLLRKREDVWLKARTAGGV